MSLITVAVKTKTSSQPLSCQRKSANNRIRGAEDNVVTSKTKRLNFHPPPLEAYYLLGNFSPIHSM